MSETEEERDAKWAAVMNPRDHLGAVISNLNDAKERLDNASGDDEVHEIRRCLDMVIDAQLAFLKSLRIR